MFIFASWLGTAIAGFAAFLAGSMTKKVATVVAVGGTTIVLTATMWGAIAALVNSTVYALPPEVGIAIGWFIPTNTKACFAALISARLIRFAYDLRAKVISNAASA